MNLGLRWDYFGVPIDQDGAWRTFSFDNLCSAPNGTKIPAILPVPIGSKGAIKLWQQEKRFFMPRVGLAYRPANKWVIRSGAGWFADVEHLNTFTILANMPPFGISQQFDAVTDPGKTVTVTANQTEYRIATRQFRPAAPSLLQLVEEVLHERILRFRIPGASSLPTRLDGLWRPGRAR